MNFEKMMDGLRKGGKFRRPGMQGSYIIILPNTRCPASPSGKLVFVNQMGSRYDFSLTGDDMMADDWVDAEPIVEANMFSEAYYIRCPNCTRKYSVGLKWEMFVGDVYKCTCGRRILLKPPVEYVVDQKITAAPPTAGCRTMAEKIEEERRKQWPGL